MWDAAAKSALKELEDWRRKHVVRGVGDLVWGYEQRQVNQATKVLHELVRNLQGPDKSNGGISADAFRAKHGDRYNVVTALDPAHVETPDLGTAYAVAEFLLNLLNV